MLLAEIISIMPSVASRISTGNSNLSNFSALAKPTDITRVTTDPPTARSLKNRANGSDTKAPPKAVPSVPKKPIQPSAKTRMATASPLTVLVALSLEKTPIIRRTSAPTATISSGAPSDRLCASSAVMSFSRLR